MNPVVAGGRFGPAGFPPRMQHYDYYYSYYERVVVRYQSYIRVPITYTCTLTGTFISRGGGKPVARARGTNDPLLSSTRAHLHDGSLRPSVGFISGGPLPGIMNGKQIKTSNNENTGTEEEENERVRGRSTYG